MKLKILSILLALVVVALSVPGAMACSDNNNCGGWSGCDTCGWGGCGLWNCNWDWNWNCFWNWIWNLCNFGCACDW